MAPRNVNKVNQGILWQALAISQNVPRDTTKTDPVPRRVKHVQEVMQCPTRVLLSVPYVQEAFFRAIQGWTPVKRVVRVGSRVVRVRIRVTNARRGSGRRALANTSASNAKETTLCATTKLSVCTKMSPS